ncbi:MAG: potassium channel family protein, partial [Desulfuromonadaceae bacterium]
MAYVATISGIFLILLVLWEGFETIVLPRRVTRRFRLTRFFYWNSWRPWVKMVKILVPARRRESWLSYFGPLSLLLLLSFWAGGLIIGFALIHWALGSSLLAMDSSSGILTDLYLSGTTFFTLGLGDALPRTSLARLLVVVESGMGFAFLALVIGYLPALNQSFARREVSISLLDARAGSPPTASEMLRRHGHEQGREALRQLLHEWERWSAEFLEGHLSYPVLAYFRSQHDNQSWLASLTAILDTCALIMAGV